MNTRRFGVTLIELLVCLAIMGMIGWLAMPFSPSFYQKNQLHVIVDEMKSAIRYAKLQAIIRGKYVILTPKADLNNWSSGMALYMENATAHPWSTSRGELIYEWTWPSTGTHIVWHGFQSNDYLRFAPELSQSAVNGSFLIDINHQHQIKLMVNRLGRVTSYE